MRDFPETPLTRAYRAAHVHQIGVAEAARRTGVARRLVRAVEAAARERGVERLTADVWAFNDEACGFFDRFGLAPYMLRYWR
jgi:ribosomal protein S18 acetylase RimI-like enzyme